MFEFGKLAETSFTSTASRSLKPYGIYEVSLKDISLKDIQGKKDPNAVYHTIHLEFEGEEGTYQENLFIPSTEEDAVRPTYKNPAGHDYQRPSRFENYQYTLMQIVEAINPSGAKKIKDNASKIRSIETFNDAIIKALTNKGDVKVNLKLVGRNVNGTVYAQLPSACGVNKAGEIFPTNFIGKDLFFSNYEQQQADALKNAKPTTMPASVLTNDTPETDDLDFDEL